MVNRTDCPEVNVPIHVFFTIGFVSLAENLLVIVAISWNRNLHSPMYCFIGSLAAFNTFASVIKTWENLMITFADVGYLRKEGSSELKLDEVVDSLMCMSFMGSIFSFLAIAGDRYVCWSFYSQGRCYVQRDTLSSLLFLLSGTSPSSMHFATTTSWPCSVRGPSWASSGPRVVFQPRSWWSSSIPTSSWAALLSSSLSPWQLSTSCTSTCSSLHVSTPGRLLPCPTAVGGSSTRGDGALAWGASWLWPSCLGHLWFAGHHFFSTSSSSWCAPWTRTASATDLCLSFTWFCSWATPSLIRASTPFASLSWDTPSGGCCSVWTGGGCESLTNVGRTLSKLKIKAEVCESFDSIHMCFENIATLVH